jgi:hypothetical protein
LLYFVILQEVLMSFDMLTTEVLTASAAACRQRLRRARRNSIVGEAKHAG